MYHSLYFIVKEKKSNLLSLNVVVPQVSQISLIKQKKYSWRINYELLK